MSCVSNARGHADRRTEGVEDHLDCSQRPSLGREERLGREVPSLDLGLEVFDASSRNLNLPHNCVFHHFLLDFLMSHVFACCHCYRAKIIKFVGYLLCLLCWLFVMSLYVSCISMVIVFLMSFVFLITDSS